MTNAAADAPVLPPSGPAADPIPGLFSRAIGVITSPGATFAHVARSPKVAGMLFLTSAIIALAQGIPQFTERGRAAALEMQVQGMESWGMTVTDEMYAEMQKRSSSNVAPIISIVSIMIFMPFGALIVSGLLWVIFNAIMGGTATFKHVMAVVAHSYMISALGAAISAPIMYARGVMSSSVFNLGAALPMLEETSFLAKLLGMIDFFMIWWLIVLAIGLGVLYKRKTGSVATGLFTFYALCVLVIAYFTAG
jgi:hypothetical protein